MTTIITRAEWGARRRKPGGDTVEASARQALMLHYTTGEELGREDTAEWVREIQAYHQDSQEWTDIGYNFLVDREGRIFEGRGWDYAGAHCSGHNVRAWGVAFLGDDDAGRDVTDEAWASFYALLDEAEARAGHRLEREGHRDGFATTCPGDEIYETWTKGERRPTAPRPSDPTKAPARRPSEAAPLPQKGPSTIAPDYPLRGGRLLSRGSTGRYVAQAQKQLSRRGWTIAVDGVFGPKTEAVVRAFQEEKFGKGKHVDGIIGPKTWAALWLAPLKGRYTR